MAEHVARNKHRAAVSLCHLHRAVRCPDRTGLCLQAQTQNPQPGPFPHTYFLAFLRFAQYAFIRFPISFFSAALHRRRFCVVLG